MQNRSEIISGKNGLLIPANIDYSLGGAGVRSAHNHYCAIFDRKFKLGAATKNAAEQQIEFEQLQQQRFKQ